MSKYGVMVMGPAGAGKVSSLHPKHRSLSIHGTRSVPGLAATELPSVPGRYRPSTEPPL